MCLVLFGQNFKNTITRSHCGLKIQVEMASRKEKCANRIKPSNLIYQIFNELEN